MAQNPGTTAGLTIILGSTILLVGLGLLFVPRPSAASAFLAIGFVTLVLGFFLRARVLRGGSRPTAPAPAAQGPPPVSPPKPATRGDARPKMNIDLMADAAELPGEIPAAKPTKLVGVPETTEPKKTNKST